MIDLVEDPDRLRAHPEVRLRAWEHAAVPLGAIALEDADLGNALARSVLVDPQQAREPAVAIVERLLAAAPVSPEARLAVADGLNALACLGVELPDRARERIAAWLPDLTAVEPPLPGRLRGALAALALGDLQRARYVAAEPHGPLVGGLAFPNDTLSLVGYLIGLVRAGGSAKAVDQALRSVGEELDALCASGQLDEATIVWLARIAFHHLGGAPLAEIAQRAHDWLWRVPAALDQARREAASKPPAFPRGRTLGGGAYRVEQWLRGTGAQRLYRGVELATGDRVLIALDDYSARRQDLAELRAAVSRSAPGLFELAHVGTIDDDAYHWAIVEKVPAGEWLPRVLGPADPSTATRKAIELGASAGRILRDAAGHGLVLAQIRPELMWAERSGARYAVTGLSARAIDLFRRARGDAFTHPLFERWYRAPEHDVDPDDRAVSFALAVMIAEWATGRYPLRSAFGAESAEHDPIEAPAALRRLLEGAIRANRADRPRLSELVDALERL